MSLNSMFKKNRENIVGQNNLILESKLKVGEKLGNHNGSK